uniref:Sema domain-containing protein n=1 Tax=Sus scrofa TaxID=9823 RepID=A0A8D0RS22_PIG
VRPGIESASSWVLVRLVSDEPRQELLPTDFSLLTPSHHLSTGDGRRVLSLFHQKGLQDFDTLLLSGDGGTLYVGAREAILALNIQDPGVPRLKNMIPWPASDRKKSECAFKKKSNETQCFNFIRVLVSFNATHLYACGTFAFSPACTFIVSTPGREGKDPRCGTQNTAIFGEQ